MASSSAQVTLPLKPVFGASTENRSESSERAPPKQTAKKDAMSRPLWQQFMIAGAATSCACVFSNPMEVVKTRMQLQGELQRKGAGRVVYANLLDAFSKIIRQEGIRGIQSGLAPGILYQLSMNGTRLGLYPTFQKLFGSTPERPSVGGNLAAGALSGMTGACLGSPFFLVKARLQSQAKAALRAEADSFHYKGVVDAFRSIIKEDGLRGVLRGVDGAVLRVGVGSAAQLATYSQSKHFASQHLNDTLLVLLAASFLSGLAVTTAMNPVDVISTRLYNQRGHSRYSGVFDCAMKIAETEGPRGFFKGWTAHYLRLGPHTLLTFVFWEQATKAADALEGLWERNCRQEGGAPVR
uniref:Mitochondrial carrier protein n=1 Tax=Chromera velia CCMP2878 TaxID=1169474 RepID=A0A0G4I6V6_9ALVE|mmetsp:Transcript_29237/g.57397  ORF Transcript_29237/g.57397 Transcript_29237/m.57397 type:complete len:353 (+) Transcript_29237:281-1339(+)|eukprot:Cvel_1901.t1-p1 / transcript=Cvel_1901.t1 / gene=Cvel_1901 / organism=Chromera_velia_CCMP2878 / gene_product=Solute carrier family 25 member 35, putative / transcript_product=Solute carrier family 25 member 35, putative / location=Cvel_scaffold71:59920-61920(-) / protein_length=352 / sequence_SO=supercontig / SO=protein_coding / is_pseudo=false